ncbi:MAG: multicopper oxidase domain-containing protein [Deltaproteobacteria bacterium]|nr:multicopper oxidase domain-containing protein [Deltaproteobacteria bacterium]
MRDPKGISRRAVLRGTVAGAAALSSARLARAVSDGEAAYVPAPNAAQQVLRVGAAQIAPAGGAAAPAVLLNGALPGPELRLREGEQFRVLVENGLADTPTAIHWHGVLVPAGMDGVPDISNAPIAPQQMYVYEYPLRQSGTYWYHSHYGFQEQLGCYGALVIEPAVEPLRVDRDAVVLLGDWLRKDPTAVFEALRGDGGGAPSAAPAGGAAALKMDGMKMGDMPMGGSKPAVPMPGGRPMSGMGAMALPAAPKPTAGAAQPMAMGKPTPGAMAMGGKADLSDVQYDAFLLNGRGQDAPWALQVNPGERVRLRLINGAASTYFRLALDGHRLRITHADGLAVEPVEVDHLLMGMGETYDAVVTVGAAGSYTLHAVAQDGSGQAIGVLHTPGVTPQPDRTLPSFSGRALSYAELRAPSPTVLPDGPVRTFRLPLQGDMARYIWKIDGQAWPQAAPLPIRRGERVQIELPNETMMWHPMHLHGHFFRLLQGAGDYCPLKHTVNVAPGETVRIEFTADNPGRWFFHCHNAYHLEAGMARVFEYVI